MKKLLITVCFCLVSGLSHAAPVTFLLGGEYFEDASVVDGLDIDLSLTLEGTDSLSAGSALTGSATLNIEGFSPETFSTFFVANTTTADDTGVVNFLAPDLPNQFLSVSFTTQVGFAINTVADIVTLITLSSPPDGVTFEAGYAIFLPDSESETADFDGRFSRISVSEVPLPAGMWLFASAIAGLAGLRRMLNRK